MKSISFLFLCFSFTACGPAAGGGSSSADAGASSADAGASSADAGPARTPTICDLHASNVFAACTGCHSARSASGGLFIDTSSEQALHDSLTQNTGNSGNALVVSGDSDGSWLWVRMAQLQGEGSMPPAAMLFSSQRNPVRDWIDGDALGDCL
jgi:hypothetical protein